MIIQHNIAANNAHRQLGGNNKNVSKNLEKLSSGYKINRAGDDAAGLAISEKMRAQIKGLETASKNANDGVSLIQTAEGALTEVHSMLNRMVELATQSANGTYGEKERQKIQDEVDSLKSEIDRIADATDFNGTKLLNGSLGGYNLGTITYADDSVTSVGVSGGGLTHGDVVGELAMDADGIITLDLDDTVVDTLPATTVGIQDNITLEPASLTANSNGTYSFKIVVDMEKAEKDIDADTTITAETKKATLEALAKLKDVTVTVSTGAADNTGKFTALADTLLTVTEKTAGAGDVGNGLTLQVGDTNDAWQKVNVNVDSMKSKSLGIDTVSVSTKDGAAGSIQKVKDAIEKVSTARGNLGALQNRLDHTINNLGVTTENMTAAESRIRDVDMAKEMMDFTKNNILTQAAQAMLAQANQIPQGVLQLLQ